MSPVKRSSQEEDAFMNDLLSNDSLWDSPPPAKAKASAPVTPVRKQKACEKAKRTPQPVHTIDDEDLLEGIDDWDDFDISPRKPSPKKVVKAEVC